MSSALAPSAVPLNARGGRRSVLVDLAAIAALAVGALLLHRDGLFGGPAFYELDTRLFYYPLAQWVGQQLHAGVFPLWLPGIFTGYPIFADGELGLAYPPQVLLLYLLNPPLAMAWMRVLHVFLAGLFTYLYLKTLRLDPLPALGGALVFAFGSFLTAQMHHENVIRSAVWLPAVLACAERAVQQHAQPFRIQRFTFWTALGALAFSQSALGLHVQPVLMLGLALGAFVVFRALVPPGRRGERRWPGRSAYWPLLNGALIVGGGLALAAVQWLPLGEWALVSSRRGGVDYEFASAFGLSPENLPTLIFPYFFRLPDATTWWTLWQQWETELYVGIPTLALAVVGIVFSRRSELVYFVLLATVSLVIGMAQSAPLFNLHQVLWSIPGFSFLRAPGRFSYLVVFALACLAGLGLQALAQRRLRLVLALVGGVPSVALLAALLALLPTWRGLLLADPARAQAFVQATYLAARAQYPIDPGLVTDGLLSSLDFGNLKTTWSLVLLGLTSLGFVAWLELGARRVLLSQGLFVGLLAVDLLVFAFDFHPRTPLEGLAPPLPGPGQTRVLLHDPSDLPALEPNQLLVDGIATVQGYSSLPSQRFVELDAATSSQPALFDLWGAPLLVVEPSNPADLHAVDGVPFRAQHPLSAGFGGAVGTTFTVPADVGSIAGLRLIGTLSYAFRVPQGQPVAMLATDTGAQVPIRAGIELSERAYDRPSLNGLVQHQKARVAFDFEDVTPEGEDYPGHLYQADLALSQPAVLQSITITPTNPEVLVEINGLALIDRTGAAHPLRLADRAGLQRVSADGLRMLVTSALPRAYVLPRTQVFSPLRHPGLTPTQLVASPDVDLHTMALVEGDPSVAQEPNGSRRALAASQVEDLGPNSVRVVASADEQSYVVLEDFYHRGWTARVDGQPTRVLIANALFRAVAIEPGQHTVELRFEPLSHLVGALVSAVSLLVSLLALGWGLRSR